MTIQRTRANQFVYFTLSESPGRPLWERIVVYLLLVLPSEALWSVDFAPFSYKQPLMTLHPFTLLASSLSKEMVRSQAPFYTT
jgi:hypothetical protein